VYLLGKPEIFQLLFPIAQELVPQSDVYICGKCCLADIFLLLTDNSLLKVILFQSVDNSCNDLLFLISHSLIMQQLFIKFSSSVYSPLHVSASL
jgi:hypothetical protein